MSKSHLFSYSAQGMSWSTGGDRFTSLIGSTGWSGTESNFQTTFRLPGTLSLLTVNITSNTCSNTESLRLRNNGADGSLVVSITASTTGKFADISHTDSISAGNKLNLKLPTLTNGALTASGVSVVFDASTNTTCKIGCFSGTFSFSTASVTRFINLCGQLNIDSTENNTKTKLDITGTLKNFNLYVSSNTRTNTTTFRVRKGGANGNQVLSVGSSATGIFEDTTNTDAVVAGNEFNYSITSSTGTNPITVRYITVELESTNGTYQLIGGMMAGATYAPSVTRFFNFGELTQDSTESNAEILVKTAFTASKFRGLFPTNTISATSTLTLRKNAADTALVVSITASTTGYFEDTTHTVDFVANDTICMKLVTGGTGTSMSFKTASLLATAGIDAIVVDTSDFFSFFPLGV